MTLSNQRLSILYISSLVVFSLVSCGQNPFKKQTIEERLRILLPDTQKVLIIKDSKGEIWIFRTVDAIDGGKGSLVLKKNAYFVSGRGTGPEYEIINELLTKYINPPQGPYFVTTWKAGGKTIKLSGIAGNAAKDITVQVIKIVKAIDCKKIFGSPCK